MIIHCKNLVRLLHLNPHHSNHILQPTTDAGYPDPYVKTYLLPNPTRLTKRKTKVARKTINPTYNQMVRLRIFLLFSSSYLL